ncbi:hypothetical protein C5167_026530 [Papaver somniferum]|uniref:norreticuline-7-O-methyltransferase-like n=1 Tax=Papaver somniferum TaxID=3469 RepID=UPI000E6FC505|nr:norreticuline-7-O-methyltransferase-like [Papaver somniferum]RZC85854.1 hypothetical protein C5167_026530 [Papaver somniferum]
MEVVSQNDQENQAIIWQQIYGFSESLILKCAVQLEIAETIHHHGTPMSISELAAKLPIDQPVNMDRLYRVMRYLVHMKLFNKEEIIYTHNGGTVEKYSLAPPAKYLIRGSERSMVPSILGTIHKDLLAAWDILKDSLTGNCNVFEKALGRNISVYYSENLEMNKISNEAMAFDSGLFTSALVNECKSVFGDDIKTLVDVGGGTGTAIKAISMAFPNIKCTLFDLPHVIDDSPETPTITKISGDMFKSIPSADAIFMKNILHDWNDDECIQILKRCKDAVSPGGKLIIVEMVMDMDSVHHPYSKLRLASDMDMMVSNGGKERTEKEWKELFDPTGFACCKITQMSAGFAAQSVIEVFIDDVIEESGFAK